MYWLYIITLREDERSYIGWTDDLEYRWQRHKRDAFNGSKTCFHHALKEHGPDSFDWNVVQAFDTEDEVKQAEIFWIAELNTNQCQGGRGFNSTVGGDGSGGHKMTDEVRLEQSKRLKALGDNHPSKRPETRLKMSLTIKAKGDAHHTKRADVRAKNSATQRAKGEAHQSRRSEWRARHSKMLKAKGENHASKRADVRLNMSLGHAKTIEQSASSKLTWEKVYAIRASSKLLRELAEEFDVSMATISLIRRYKIWNRESVSMLEREKVIL